MVVNLSPDDIELLDVFLIYILPSTAFILGFFASRLSMFKKERKDHEYQLLKTSRELIDAQSEAFEEFSTALFLYVNNDKEPDLDDFFSISTKGELYFNRIGMACDAIIARSVDENSIRNSIFPEVKETVEKSLPEFYITLTEISKREGIEYSGELKRENYESIYAVYESHA